MNPITVSNPYDGSIVGTTEAATPETVAVAVERANAAFRRDSLCAIDRHDILERVSEILEARKDEFAALVTAESGKTIRESLQEVDRACTTLRWSAHEALRIEGIIQPCDVTSQRIRRHAHAKRAPVGVVTAITPFNFPLNLPAHKMGPALAAGNACIVKPSPKAPLATRKLVELFLESGLDPFMLQVLDGGAEIACALAGAAVHAVSFTGSTLAGQAIAARAAGKKLVMELGGNDPVVVLPDADLEAAADAVVAHRFALAGQRCTSCKRAIIHRTVYANFRERVLEKVKSIVTGNPAEAATDMGPVIDQVAADSVMNKLEEGKQDGIQVLAGGGREGTLIQPTVIEGIQPESPLIMEETFGPILPLVPFGSMEEAVSLVNSTPYGLQAGIFTNGMQAIQEAFNRFEVGTIIVNDGPGFRVESIPFGGVKASGLGSEGIRHAIESFTRWKTLVL